MVSFIPHSDIVLTQIRTVDIWFLLTLGAVWELICRVTLLAIKRKPASILLKEQELQKLQKQVEYKRKMGPSAFVETSKLERQFLQAEKELNDLAASRQARFERVEKLFKRHGTIFMSLVVYVAYYGVPLLTLDALEVTSSLDEFISADTYMKTLLFPVSMIGLGNKFSRWGLEKSIANSSISALIVMWSSQVTVGMIMDAAEAYVLL